MSSTTLVPNYRHSGYASGQTLDQVPSQNDELNNLKLSNLLLFPI
jgi:hypothetical protein